MLEVLSSRSPEQDPVETFLALVDALKSIKVHGATTNVLGIPDFDQEHLVVLGTFLRGASVPEATQALVDALPDEDASAVRTLAAEIVEALAGSSVLRQLVPTPADTVPAEAESCVESV